MKENQDNVENQEKPRKKRRWFWRALKYFSLFLLLLIFAVFGALYWVCQTSSGQAWLLSTINSALSKDSDKPVLHFVLTSLSGSLPFNFKFGLEARDSYGLWLNAPNNSFVLNWKELPKKIHLSELLIVNADLSRFPMLPEKTESAPSEPFTPKDFQGLLSECGDFLYTKHWWMPNLLIEGIGVKNFRLPHDLFQKDAKEESDNRARLDTGFKLDFTDNRLNLNGDLKIAPAIGDAISMPSLSFKGANLNINASLLPKAEEHKLSLQGKVTARTDKPLLQIDGIPENFLGDSIVLNLKLGADAITSSQKPVLSLLVEGPDLKAGALGANANFSWQSGKEWINGEIDGAEKFHFQLDYQPVDRNWLESHAESPLAYAPDPVKLLIQAQGELPETNLVVDLCTASIQVAKKDITDVHFLVKSDNLVIPLDGNAIKALENERNIDFSLNASPENIPAKISGRLSLKALESGKSLEETNWLATLKNIVIQGGGAEAGGEIAANIKPGTLPLLNGNLSLEVKDFATINKFLPEMKLAGKLGLTTKLNAERSSNLPAVNAKPTIPGPNYEQNFQAMLEVPNLQLEMGTDKYSLSGFKANVSASDIFKTPNLALNINAADIQAAGLKLALKSSVNGKLTGPINALVSTSGSIAAKIDASWNPGELNVRTLNVDMALPASMSPSGKASNLAIHSRKSLLVNYGSSGLNIRGLDLTLTPSGHLHGHASLSENNLDCSIKLDNLNFKPWQALMPQLPSGGANLTANLAGSPKKPSGSFQLNIKDVKVPVSGLPPISLALKGGIENRGAASQLRVALNLDPATIKALGGTVAEVRANLPLTFGANGIPKPDMNGKLAARVRWDGALGPLWNLVPVADMRLNGRLNINVNADGRLSAPRISGGVNINKARFEEVALGVLLTDINAKVDLKDSLPGLPPPDKNASIKLPGGAQIAFSASDGRGGTINIDGIAGLMGDGLNIKTKINRLKPLRRRDIHIDLSGNAAIKGSASAPDISGEIIVNQGEVLLNNLEITSSVTTLPITEPGKKEPAKKETAKKEAAASKPQGSGSLNVRVRMLPRFTVEGRGLTSIWQANLLVEGTPTDPRITGNISSVKGNFDFLGKNFALSKGIVFFGGGLVSNPLLDIEMTNETPDLTAHIIISGPVNKIKLSMSSDPSLPRDEILSRVLFGKSVGDLSRMEALQLAGAVAQLAGFGGGTGILGMAKKALGVDVLRLGTSSSNAAGEPGDQTAGGTTIEMGKYINDMIYMGVQQGMQPDSTAFIIQLELTPRTSLEVRTEQNNTWGGLQWKYNY